MPGTTEYLDDSEQKERTTPGIRKFRPQIAQCRDLTPGRGFAGLRILHRKERLPRRMSRSDSKDVPLPSNYRTQSDTGKELPGLSDRVFATRLDKNQGEVSSFVFGLNGNNMLLFLCPHLQLDNVS